MNTLDWVILSFGGLLALFGYRKGLILSLYSFASGWLAFFVALHYQGPLAAWLKENLPVQPLQDLPWLLTWLYRLVAFFLLLFLMRYLLKKLGHLLRVVHWLPVLSTVDRLLGAGLLLVIFFLCAVLVSPLLPLIPSEEWLDQVEGSRLLYLVNTLWQERRSVLF